jgi:hypothetical protein
VQVRRVPGSHGILECIMQLTEGIPGWNVECAFDDGVGGTDEGEVKCISIPFRRKEKRVRSMERIVVQYRHTPPAIFLMKFPILPTPT